MKLPHLLILLLCGAAFSVAGVVGYTPSLEVTLNKFERVLDARQDEFAELKSLVMELKYKVWNSFCYVL